MKVLAAWPEKRIEDPLLLSASPTREEAIDRLAWLDIQNRICHDLAYQ